MKKLITIISLFAIMISCNAQKEELDVEQLTFNENVKELLKDYKLYSEFNTLLMLPEIQTNSISGFRFGDVSFSNGGDIDELIGKGNRSKEIKEKMKSITNNSINFMIRDTVSMKINSIRIQLYKECEAVALEKYIAKKYGKGTLMKWEENSKNESYLWRNYKKEYILAISKNYDKQTFYDEEGMEIFNGEIPSLELYIVDKNVKPMSKFPVEETSAIRMIRSLSHDKINTLD